MKTDMMQGFETRNLKDDGETREVTLDALKSPASGLINLLERPLLTQMMDEEPEKLLFDRSLFDCEGI